MKFVWLLCFFEGVGWWTLCYINLGGSGKKTGEHNANYIYNEYVLLAQLLETFVAACLSLNSTGGSSSKVSADDSAKSAHCHGAALRQKFGIDSKICAKRMPSKPITKHM